MDFNELTTADWLNVMIYGSIATYLASAIPGLFRGDARAAIAALAFWAAVLFGIVLAYSYRTELGTVAERVMAVLVPGTAVDTGFREVTIFRSPDGQFVVNALVGSIRMPFVLDTGASAVVLRAEDATRLRLPIDRHNFDVEVSTANGRSLATEVELPRLSIGAIAETHVKALVARPGALHENLLGMSFLNELASFTVSKDRLVLRGR